MKKMLVAIWLISVVPVWAQVTTCHILENYYHLNKLPEYQTGTFCHQISSYDTTGGNDDGFSGRYSHLRRNADSTLVIFDQEGPAVIERIWTPTPSDDSLAFYVDDKLALKICFRDLFSGKVMPFVLPLCGNQLGGYYCYWPILFQKNCKIVYLGKRIQFIQIQYRKYPAKTMVNSFNSLTSAQDLACFRQLKSLWAKPDYTVEDFYTSSTPVSTSQKTILLPAGVSVEAFQLNQGGRILGLEILPAEVFGGWSKDIDLKITWDEEPVPAIYAPVADFFGYAFGRPSMQSLIIGSKNGKNYCYFPMPYDRKARIELINRQDSTKNNIPLTISVKITYQLIPRKPAEEGKFYAYYHHRQHPAHDGHHTLAEAFGHGHYVGTVLLTQGLKAGMTTFFEGDDSTNIDGQPRHHGTGSEDYFNGGWYALMDRWDAAMSLPLHGALDYALPFGRTGGYRLFMADKLSFDQYLYHGIEHGPVANEIPAIYTSLGYLYAGQPALSPSQPALVDTKVYHPDTLTLYPQLMNFGIQGGLDVATSWAYPTGGETYDYQANDNTGLRISLQEIPVGKYQVFLDYVTDPNGCVFSLWQRQTQLTDWINGYQEVKTRKQLAYLTDVEISNLVKTITFHFRSSPGHDKFILNRLILVKIPDQIDGEQKKN